MPVVLQLADQDITIPQLGQIAHQQCTLQLSPNPSWREKIHRGRQLLEEKAASGDKIYGVNTGFGRTSRRHIEAAHHALQTNLIRMHGCGVGPHLSPIEARAIMAARLICLAKGYSGVRLELLETLAHFINAGVTPVIPSFGSVGASGDLTPLSYLGALLVGERNAFYQGKEWPALQALQQANLSPFSFAIREGLAVINGTSMMTALGSLLTLRVRRLLSLAERCSALALELIHGRQQAMHPTIHTSKPHPGQIYSAQQIRNFLQGSQMTQDQMPIPQGQEVQDRYSIRCAPHLLGAARDALTWVEQILHTELNSVNDNPIVDPDGGQILNGGNFYGGHVALAMDLLKTSLGSVINLFDRQFAFLVSDAVQGLPETLLPQDWLPKEEHGLHHGLKALQITVSSLTSLAHQRAYPDTVLSRQTECDNQDVVSMGTNASLNARAVLEFAEWGLSSWLIALSQAAANRGEEKLSPAGQTLLEHVRKHAPIVRRDRALDTTIQQVLTSFIHQDDQLP